MNTRFLPVMALLFHSVMADPLFGGVDEKGKVRESPEIRLQAARLSDPCSGLIQFQAKQFPTGYPENFRLLLSRAQFFPSIYRPERNYKILNWETGIDYKNLSTNSFIEQLTSNFANVFITKDGEYLISPLNPFGKSILTKQPELIDQWIRDGRFPTGEYTREFYFKHHREIDHLYSNQTRLAAQLLSHLELSQYPKTREELEQVEAALKKKDMLNKFTFHLAILFGRALIEAERPEKVTWAILKSRQLLNPVNYLVLIKKVEGAYRYYNLEDDLVQDTDLDFSAIGSSNFRSWRCTTVFDQLIPLAQPNRQEYN